jgi:membrane protein DedA with SNARE-associated domain
MIDWLFSLDGQYLYGGIFLMLLGGAFGLPIPEDLPLLLGGVLLHQQKAELGEMFLVCYTGIIIGDIILFTIGKRIGASSRNRGWFESKLSPKVLRKTRLAIERKSFITILIARHLFYLRTVTFLACGALKMSYTRFIIADMFAALISASFMLSFGFMFSDSYEYIISVFKTTKLIVFLAVGIIVVWIYLRIRKTRQEKLKHDVSGDETVEEL